ncbi:MAG: hypothetical protein KJ062_23425 [Thermoanaerobaculia bacterium]|nr:hypothetical protein [Thermoanaerobaculia bacterium]
MQEITITMKGDGGVDLTRARSFDDTEALGVFIALTKTLGDDPPKRRGRRAASATTDDMPTLTTPDTEG